MYYFLHHSQISMLYMNSLQHSPALSFPTSFRCCLYNVLLSIKNSPTADHTAYTTEETIDFFNAIKVERSLRGFKWWILHSLQEYADVDERAATQVSLDKATRLDDSLNRSLEVALATQGGIP